MRNLFSVNRWPWLLSATIFIALSAVNTWTSAQNIAVNTAKSVVTTPQVQAELVAYAPDGVEPGKTVMVGLQITHKPEWHTYWKNSGDSGQPTELQWTLPAGVTAGDIQWPTPKKIRIGTLANYGYEGTVLLPVPLEVSQMFQPGVLSNDLEVKLKAVWLVCKQECIPEEGEFALKIPVKGSTALSAPAFATAKAASPVSVPNLDVGKSTARIVTDPSGGRLEFSIHNLPVALRGQNLELYPETAEVLHNAATAGKDWTQAWNGVVWTASMPLSAQRSASPSNMALVLAAASGQAYSVQAAVLGDWPKVAAPAQVPPELAAALKANAASQQAPVNTAGQPLSSSDAMSFLPALLLALVGGMILNLMPCVFPVLAIKVMGFTQQAHLSSRTGGETVGGKSSMVGSGVAYTVGVVLSFVALGGLMLALRAGGEALGWGFQLQSPAVVAVLAALFTLIGLNLLGVFEFANVLPSSIATLQAKNPQIDAFLSGVLAAAIASPCTAPFMGASLGFALGLPAWQALSIFAFLGIGMALPYLLASVIPAVARWLPRPGAWMDVFKKVMAFPMFATVVWLVWVLGQQSGVDGAGALLLLLVGISMLVWGFSLRGRSKWVVTIISIAALAVFTWTTGSFITQNAPEGAISGGVSGGAQSAAPQSTGAWQAWEPGKVDQLLAKGQPVFVDFTAAWCVTCQVNKKTTLNNPDVLADFSAKKVQLLRADWTRRDPAITQALAALGRQGVPVYVLYKPGSAPVVMSEILSSADVRAAIAKL
jgi:thiol:disulfide interchange protein/DsbC/DsbD-like thiol-disulfide interchange protein